MPSKIYPQARIDELSKILDITQAEVLEMLKDDERIDKGEKLFELDAELEKGAKKARQAPRSANSTPTKRERKADTDKEKIRVNKIINFLNVILLIILFSSCDILIISYMTIFLIGTSFFFAIVYLLLLLYTLVCKALKNLYLLAIKKLCYILFCFC